MDESVNFYGSLVCFTGCMTFIVVYTIMPFLTHRRRWWQDPVGRLLVTKAAALAGLMLIVILLYLFDLELSWVRQIRGVFASLIGIMMFYQAALVYKIQRQEEDN